MARSRLGGRGSGQGRGLFALLLPLLLARAQALNCSAPNASLIDNAMEPTCEEGSFIDAYFYCTPQCKEGYSPVQSDGKSILNCFPNQNTNPPTASLYPETFYCDAQPCRQPDPPPENALPEPCGAHTEGAEFPAHKSLCIPQCEDGYQPSIKNLTCLAGRLYPPTFECNPLPCVLSSYNVTVRCQEPGDVFYHGDNCTPACPFGYEPNVPQLQCILGNLTPPSFNCSGLPCQAPDVPNGHINGTCAEGDQVEHGQNCTAQCGEGYEPWCSDEPQPRDGCELRCAASVFNNTFKCAGRPCAAPSSGSVENAAVQVCKEGPLIQHNSTCSPQCADGYVPSVPALHCSLTHLSPPSFVCIGLPCAAPEDVPNAAPLACAGSAVVGHDDVCETRCAFGYVPDVSVLHCSATVLSPPAFTCIGLDCPVPTDIPHADDPACRETHASGNVSHGSVCTARCRPLYQPLVRSLQCVGSVLRPSRFACVSELVLADGERMVDDVITLGISRHMALTSLDEGLALLCYRDVRPPHEDFGRCLVVVGSTDGLWKGPTVEIPGELDALTLVRAASREAVACYRDLRRQGGVFCRRLRADGFMLEVGEEAAASTEPTWRPALAGFGDAAVLCYQRGSSTAACRALRPQSGKGSGLELGDEERLGLGIPLYLAAAGLEDNVGVVCLADGLRQRRVACQALVLNGTELVVGPDEEVSEAAARYVSVAALGSSAVVCYAEEARGERGFCRSLEVLPTDGGKLRVLLGHLVEVSAGVTRHLVLSPVGPGRAMVCYQGSAFAGQQDGFCRVLEHAEAPGAGSLSVEDPAPLGAGAEAMVSGGRTWNMALAQLFEDTVLVCYADTSEQEHGKCKVIWGAWLWRVAEARVCERGPLSTSCVA